LGLAVLLPVHVLRELTPITAIRLQRITARRDRSYRRSPRPREPRPTMVLLLGSCGLLPVVQNAPKGWMQVVPQKRARCAAQIKRSHNEQALTGRGSPCGSRLAGCVTVPTGPGSPRDARLPEEHGPVPCRRCRLPQLRVRRNRRSECRPAGKRMPRRTMQSSVRRSARAWERFWAPHAQCRQWRGLGCRHGTADRKHRGQQQFGLFVVSTPAPVRRRVHAVHVWAREPGARARGESRRTDLSSAQHELDSARLLCGERSSPNPVPGSYPPPNYPPPNYPPPNYPSGSTPGG
jgi:hypothetical protein